MKIKPPRENNPTLILFDVLAAFAFDMLHPHSKSQFNINLVALNGSTMVQK